MRLAIMSSPDLRPNIPISRSTNPSLAMFFRIVLGAVIGGALGFGYYKFVGCASGACPLTSHPVSSTIYGTLMGALLAGSLH